MPKKAISILGSLALVAVLGYAMVASPKSGPFLAEITSLFAYGAR